MNKNEAAVQSPMDVMVESGKTYWWCACGKSKSQPFCDGSHKGTAFTPLKYQATHSARKWFCICKQSQERPFCDGVNRACAGIPK